MLAQFGRQGPEAKRISQEGLFGVENAYKAIGGEWRALLDKTRFQQKIDAENALRQTVTDPEKVGAWDEIARAQRNFTEFYDCLLYTSDAADDLRCVDLGGRRFIKKKN